MYRKAYPLIVLAGWLMSATSQAHFFSEAHQCKGPLRPLEFTTEQDKQQFEQKVENYRVCLQQFINKQNAAMTKHQTAGKKAADTWSEYAQRVLDAKAVIRTTP